MTPKNITSQTTIDQILSLLDHDFAMSEELSSVLEDVDNLYSGNWPEYEACQAPYHTFQHALDVTLTALRMASGWNTQNPSDPLAQGHLTSLVIASLFHDSGYIKDKGDEDGFGGKYSFTHILRSQTICAQYLTQKQYPESIKKLVFNTIETTDFEALPDLDQHAAGADGIIARMVGSSDIIAQMADIKYMDHLADLYEEFSEAYEFHGKSTLQKKNIQVFDSFDELLSSTIAFYENIVRPRLNFLGRMDQYLITYFGEKRNPYLENIIANLSAKTQVDQVKWQKLGEILLELDLVSKDVIDEALSWQKKHLAKDSSPPPLTGSKLQDRLFRWADHSPESSQLGDILMQMHAVDPPTLRKGILSQLIPEDLINILSREELVFLLNISMLVQNTKHDPWVFNQVMQMVNEAIGCQNTSLYLADSEAKELVCVLFAGVGKYPRKKLSIDKGLPGWVYSKGRTSFLQKGMLITQNTHHKTVRISDDIGSLLGVPLYTHGTLVGVLELSEKESSFTSHDADIMTVVAHILSGLLQAVSLGYDH
jgi:putative methionine-R-sulfoxide reductase with GAF domain